MGHCHGRRSGGTLFHLDAHAVRAIQQALEVEASRAASLRMLSDVSGERGNGIRIAGFELGKRVQITLGHGVVVMLVPERFECPQRLGFAPQHEVADRASAEAFDLVGKSCAHADAGAKLLVCRFQPRRDIDGVAIGGVVEKSAAAEITYNRRSGMNADARGPKRNSLSWQRWRNA